MSNISNRHSVIPFVSGETKALSDQRLAKVGYKQTVQMTKDGIKAPKSIAVSVPKMGVPSDVQIQKLLPHIGNLLENAQDGIIRSMYESSGYSLQSVSDEDISIDACISYLTAEMAGSRIKMVDVEMWFETTMAETVSAALAVKLGIEDEKDARIVKMLAVYKELFAGLCGKMVRYTDKQISALETVMKLGEPQDRIGRYLSDKLVDQRKPVSETDMLANAL